MRRGGAAVFVWGGRGGRYAMSTANTRRVVVTGIGLVTPLGSGVDVSWKALLAGKSGAGNITTFDASQYACNVACEVPRVDGRGIGGLATIEKTSVELHEKGPRRISPFFIPSALINLASGQVSIRHGFKGPNHSVVTACATGAHAVGDAARLIKYGDADVMIAGGAEAAICPVGIAGFIACRAMSTGFNDNPTKASRPYDKDRDGLVMGE